MIPLPQWLRTLGAEIVVTVPYTYTPKGSRTLYLEARVPYVQFNLVALDLKGKKVALEASYRSLN